MRKTLLVLCVIALVAGIASSVGAATWTKVGDSVFTGPGAAAMQDFKRIRISSLAIDGAGNVYAACNKGDNGVYNYAPYTWDQSTGASHPETAVTFDGTNQGGITIFKATGGKIDVNLSGYTDPTWSGWFWGVIPDFGTYSGGVWTPNPPRSFDNKIVGAITKLVTAGDGTVYGLLNYTEIESDGSAQNQRIVKISSTGTVTNVWTPGPIVRYGNKSGTAPVFTYTPTSYTTSNKIRGLAVGGDGNVYWTMNGSDAYWKTHFLWRCTVAGDVEEAPINNANNGWGDSDRAFDLEYVGTDGQESGYFAVINSGSDNWGIDPIAWNQNRVVVTNSGSQPWNRDHVTAIAYDKTWKKLWAGGRSGGKGPWAHNGASGPCTIVDLGGGNKGIRILNDAGATDVLQYDMTSDRPMGATEMTLAARFCAEPEMTSNFNGSVLTIIPDSKANAYKSGPRITVGVDPAAHKWVLIDSADPATPLNLAVLGTVVTGQFNDVRVYAKCKTSDTSLSEVVCWWNGTKVYDSTVAGTTQPRGAETGPYVQMGSRTGWPWGTKVGSGGVTFDSVNYASKRVNPSDAWTNTVGYNVDGADFPDYYKMSTVISRWNGDTAIGGGLLGDGASPALSVVHPETVLSLNADTGHANGNDPTVTGNPNFRYWVTAMAINPNDSSCWIGTGGSASYTGDTSAIQVYNVGMGHYTEAGPLAGSQVVGLAFNKTTNMAYALTCNLATGAYSLYKTTAPAAMAPSTIAAIKAAPLGTLVQTDTAKIVTLSSGVGNFFYIEDDDRASGIKVRLAPGSSAIMPIVGEKVTITKGVTTASFYDASMPFANKVDGGEAYINAYDLTLESTYDKIQPLTTAIKNLGGMQRGIQPATLAVDPNQPAPGYMFPSCLNTTGLLVRVVGKVSEAAADGFYLDDGSGYRIKVFYSDEVVTNGRTVGITGVSSTIWNGANGVRCILALQYPDANLTTY